MFASAQNSEISPLRSKIWHHFRKDENEVIDSLVPVAHLNDQQQAVVKEHALRLAQNVRHAAQKGSNLQSLLNQYSLSTHEGIVLMCLAEALLRVPDRTTSDRLIRDKLLEGDWSSHIGDSDSFFVNASAWGLLLSGRVVGFNAEGSQEINKITKAIGKLGEPLIRAAMREAMRIMGTQFVLGRTIEEAQKRAAQQESLGFNYSYDMLGEAARTMDDANTYFDAYCHAIKNIGANNKDNDIYAGSGISVKLSALHPRYEHLQHDRVMNELVPRLKQLVLMAKKYRIGLTIDAEEADRLDLSLDVIESVFLDPDLAGWEGFGIAIQAYQKRSLHVVNWAIALSQQAKRKMMIRLVKGAYWDSEIKHAQLEGFEDYPVFTRKASTDVSYQACAAVLLDNRDTVYPQFATHNAYSVAFILVRAGDDLSGFEFQKLHGMGDGLYEDILSDKGPGVRIYAPVGEHKSLLAYLVRRLLENGANSSFVNNILDEKVTLKSLVEDPVAKTIGRAVKHNPNIALPRAIFNDQRANSTGLDLTFTPRVNNLAQASGQWTNNHTNEHENTPPGVIQTVNPADTAEVLATTAITRVKDFPRLLEQATEAHKEWSQTPIESRARCLERLADLLEQYMDEFIMLCTKEAGKTAADGIAEVREAVDFCRYYALQGRHAMGTATPWGKDGKLTSCGVVLCISPWNFPLAIFLGQITAALVAGNSVLAKPADTTFLIAQRAIALLNQCGFTDQVVQLIVADGPNVGEHLLPDNRIAGVMFTGSTKVGAWIARKLAQRPGPRIPLIAETGGQNCMVVDSTALPEQVVDDVIASGFQSAGQRCSALRVLFLQEEIADEVIKMIIGAMGELSVGNPAKLSSDVGPVIDQNALNSLQVHTQTMAIEGELLYQTPLSQECDKGTFFAPRLYEIKDIGQLKGEVFGPVVHVIRYKAKNLDNVIDAINSTGFGLTAGVHSRIQETCNRIAKKVHAGNIYINRNTIGAVVGVQPFGGHGLSGTGPKAGGPSYVYRLTKTQPRGQHSADQPPEQTKAKVDFCFEHNPSSLTTIEHSVTELNNAHPAWENTEIKQRIQKIKAFIDTLQSMPEPGLLDHAHTLINEAEALFASPKDLIGPTGEQNTLLAESRGVVLCIQQQDLDIYSSLRQVIAALLCGNTVVHLCPNHSGITSAINTSGLSNVYQRIAVNSQAEVQKLLLLDPIKAVAISASEQQSQWIDQALRKRHNAMLPLIPETIGPSLIKRFYLEKTVSKDTTASGGNASLLAMDESD